ncbi:MAG: hypothetical protein AB8B84_07950, partial [Granulosicoccus sp.]
MMKKVLTAVVSVAFLAASEINADDKSNKHVVESLMAAINDYDVDAARKVLRPEYRQHNPFIPDTAEGLLG